VVPPEAILTPEQIAAERDAVIAYLSGCAERIRRWIERGYGETYPAGHELVEAELLEKAVAALRVLERERDQIRDQKVAMALDYAQIVARVEQERDELKAALRLVVEIGRERPLSSAHDDALDAAERLMQEAR